MYILYVSIAISYNKSWPTGTFRNLSERNGIKSRGSEHFPKNLGGEKFLVGKL